MEETQQQNSVKRYITGVIISVIVLACIFFGGLPLLLVLLAVILMGSKEYSHILKMKGFHPSFSVTAVIGILLCIVIAIGRLDLILSLLVLGTIVSFLVVLFMGRQPYIANVATTELGFMYGALLPCHIMLLRQLGTEHLLIYEPSDGFYLTMFTFLGVIVTDIGAYYFGRRHGKRKLSAVISPKKTVEGAVAGGVFAVGVSLLGVLYTNLTLVECIIGGLLITVASQLGDLSESLIKRDAGVKDSSNMLPGHGGFLDRCDSYIFAFPAAYYYFVNFTQGNNFLYDFLKSMANALG
ncbi:MAG: phosphatidate cytidylyltransferase [Candidatus Gastranaerophilales bacterium]|nr:phosphatidate cytidylyltransferase [Candidatus Gastranaerophilales bacterium]